MLSTILVNIFGALGFLFIFWRELSEDYIAEQIFTTGFYFVIGAALGAVLALRFLPDYWFWGAVTFATIALVIGIQQYQLRYYETIQAVVGGALLWLGLIFMNYAVVAKDATAFVGGAVAVGLLGLFWYLDKHYKKFTWYRSGRIGFAGLTTLGMLFLIRTAVAPFADSVISFAGRFEIIASGVVSLGIFLLLWRLSRQV